MAETGAQPREATIADGRMLLLGIDTCGQSGSIALGRLGGGVEILGETELEGRSYSATLIASLGKLLARLGLRLAEVDAIVAVNGPGSFTGVRVGLSAVKGLVEAMRIPVVAVSRLEVLAAKAGSASSALDAHRSELFLRVGVVGAEPAEMLAGAAELAEIERPPGEIAVCDTVAAGMLGVAWRSTELVRVEAPTAADALKASAARVAAGEFVDPLVLDGHYLRRSDAEIFGEPMELARRA